MDATCTKIQNAAFLHNNKPILLVAESAFRYTVIQIQPREVHHGRLLIDHNH